MNNTILKKCLDELTKEAPDKGYVRGMLETLIAMNEPTASAPVKQSLGMHVLPNTSTGVPMPNGLGAIEKMVKDNLGTA